MNELQAAVAHGVYVPPSRMTVKAFLEEWLLSAKTRLRPGAYDACELHVRRYIAPRIGDLPLQGLTRNRVQRLYAELGESGRVRGHDPRLSEKTVHNIHSTLCRALADAVRNHLIAHNPAEAAHRQPDSPEQLTWTGQQVRAFLDVVATDRLYALWRLAVTTVPATRRARGTAVARRRLRGRAHRRHPATREGRRRSIGRPDEDQARPPPRIPRRRDPGGAQAAPRSARQGEGAAGHRLPGRRPRLLPGRRQGPAPRPRHEAVEPTRPRCRPSWIKVQGLRHTHAIILLQAGVHPKVVQERLGHSSIAITLDTYSHAIPAMQEDAACKGAGIIDKEPDDDQPDATDDTVDAPNNA
jgi:integrase